MYVRRFGLWCAITTLLSGCSYFSNASLTIHFNAAKLINPDKSQRALPVVLRIYQLSSPQQFMSADFNELWKRDKNTLGATLVATQVVMLSPGSHQTIKLTQHDGTNYLGVMAIFRQNKHAKWRVIKPLPHPFWGLFQQITFDVSGKHIQLEG